MKIRKTDTVRIIKGKDVGKQGKVLKVVDGGKRVVVEGVNIFKKHIKGDGREKESAIVDIVKPIAISNVMVVCPSCSKATRVGIKMIDGKRVRVCKKCGKTLDTVQKTEVKKTEKVEKKPKEKVTKKSVKVNSKEAKK